MAEIVVELYYNICLSKAQDEKKSIDHKGIHQENMSVKCIPAFNPTFIMVKLGYAGIPIFHIFVQKHGKVKIGN